MRPMSGGLLASISATVLLIVTMSAAVAQDAKEDANKICERARATVSAGGASVAPDSGQSLQHKNWQAENGIIEFTVKSFSAIPDNASITYALAGKRKENCR